jgi:tRNA (Thr-GGU) A37 N-methylase
VNIEPIGIVRSPVKEPIDEQWGRVVSQIEVKAALAAGLKGIEQFSHVMIIFFMHRYTFDAGSDLVRRL